MITISADEDRIANNFSYHDGLAHICVGNKNSMIVNIVTTINKIVVIEINNIEKLLINEYRDGNIVGDIFVVKIEDFNNNDWIKFGKDIEELLNYKIGMKNFIEKFGNIGKTTFIKIECSYGMELSCLSGEIGFTVA